MPDFWASCGYRLLTRANDGRIVVTDDFLRASLLRPELAPIPDSDASELALHEKLIAAPRAAVAPEEVAAINDDDARANYAVWLRYRERLLASPTLEAGSAEALLRRRRRDQGCRARFELSSRQAGRFGGGDLRSDPQEGAGEVVAGR